MPVMKCSRNKRGGYKFGVHGFCYISKDAKEKALRQGRAIKRSQMLKKKK